ncbi:MAG TPA: SemiSWEET transporter [Candidatus Sulfotelmatobacter sp.]|jgi:MtN3 and saliva related transmembrane protein|nr:SemiSWEET transporter [Candidatus Sulfotelmatobacter sp.]
MDTIQLLGYTAGGFVVFASLPQIIKIMKSRRTADVSLPMYITLNIGIFLWIIYGFFTHQSAIIVTNIAFQIFNIIILFLKLKHG